tara:strand:+ start:542 stop:811 length:270 start_codon:yes stop_codon:yes gene_type:complete
MASYFCCAKHAMKENSNKFIELTEIVTMAKSLKSPLTSQRRVIAVNKDKIQCAFPEPSGFTVLQMRRENIKVEENYEDVLKKINIEVPY